MHLSAAAWSSSTSFIPYNFTYFHCEPNFSHTLALVWKVYGTSSLEVAGTVLWSVDPHTFLSLTGLPLSMI